jgi:phosphoglycolate phosphatase-like HAD superfamily hydrolase
MIYCFDIDGVLFDSSEYVEKYLRPGAPDFKSYFSHLPDFRPIEPIITIARKLSNGNDVVHILTGRPANLRLQTCEQLDSVGILYTSVYMRPLHYTGSQAEYKLGIAKYVKPDLIFDDDPSAVKAFKDAGYLVGQMHTKRISDYDSFPS